MMSIINKMYFLKNLLTFLFYLSNCKDDHFQQDMISLSKPYFRYAANNCVWPFLAKMYALKTNLL